MNPHWTIAEDIFLIKSIKAKAVEWLWESKLFPVYDIRQV